MIKVHFVKGLQKIKQAAVDIRSSSKIVRNGFLNSPGTLDSRAPFLKSKLENIIGEEISKQEEDAVVKNF